MSSVSSKAGLYTGNTFLVSQNPNEYGGKQKDYYKLSNAAIEKGIKLIGEAQSKQDVTMQTVFFDCFNGFRAARGQIAEEHGTPDAKNFGILRTEDKHVKDFTTLCGSYGKYALKIRDSILGKFLPDLIDGKEVKKGDNASQFRLRIFDIPNRKECMEIPLVKLAKDNPSEYPEASKILLLNDPETFQKTSDFMTMTHYYNRVKNPPADLFNLPEENKMKAVAATIFIQVEGALVPAAEYVSIYPVNCVEGYRKSSQTVVQVTHMAQELIDSCMKEIAAIFERIVKKEKPDAASLKIDLAEFRYKFAFCMPCIRGSAAIAEWFETALAAIHGYRLAPVEGAVLDMEAFANPYYPNFVKKYDQLVELKSI